MKKNEKIQEGLELEFDLDETQCPIESIEQYITELEIDSEGKLKKELVVALKENLDKFLKSS